jgi:tagatose-1,6-bisphosphate aldolase
MYGKYYTNEERWKMSERMKGKKNPMYGVKKYKEENPFYGKHHTEETKEKLSKAQEKIKKPIAQINKQTGEIIQIFNCI